MRLNAISLSTNLFVTGMVLVMVFLLPWIDRRVCRKMGLNLEGGISRNPKAETMLKMRQSILASIFLIYMLMLSWIVFFSRSASRDYQVHVALYEDLQSAVKIDYGIFDVIRILFTKGFREAMSHIQIVNTANITQVYMNIMLFVPMGYMLP